MAANNRLLVLAILVLVLTAIQLAGVASPNWYELRFGSTVFHAGLFQVCVSGTFCVTYVSYIGANYMLDSEYKYLCSGSFHQTQYLQSLESSGGVGLGLNVHATALSYADDVMGALHVFACVSYYGFVALQVIGLVLLFAAMLVGFIASCREGAVRITHQKVGGLLCGAAGLIIGGVLWFAVSVYVNVSSAFASLSSSDMSISLGYSFFLCAVSGGLSLILGIVTCIMHCQMPQDEPGVIIATGQPMVAIQSQAYPAQGYIAPQQGYGQPQSYGQPQGYDFNKQQYYGGKY